MKIKKIGAGLLCGLFTIQVIRIYLENQYLQQLNPGYGKSTRVSRRLAGYSEDASGRYLVHRFYKSEGYGLNDISPKDITLVVHCTAERLHYLIKLIDYWKGPISVSIFAPGSDAAYVDDAIDGLRLCWPIVRKYVSFHVLYSKQGRLQANMTGSGRFAYLSCKDIMRKMMLRKRSDNILYLKNEDSEVGEGLHYPHNLMRNVALSGVLTDFILVSDIELVPSENLRNHFLEFAKRKNIFRKPNLKTKDTSRNGDTAFIVPAFEVRQEVEIERRKKDLLKAVKDGNGRALFSETCNTCHKQTNHDKWRSHSDPQLRFGVAYEVSYVTGWEPFYILKRTSPLYDESIQEYGQDRLSHVCELRGKKYKFQVLNDGFLLMNSYRYKSQMKKSEIFRRDEKTNFRDDFKHKLKESGRLGGEIIRFC